MRGSPASACQAIFPTPPACASELSGAALRFNLPRDDVQFLEHRIDPLRAHRGVEAMPASAPPPANATLMTRMGCAFSTFRQTLSSRSQPYSTVGKYGRVC